MSAHDGMNSIQEQIARWVHDHYWVEDHNCTTAVISCLAKLLGTEIDDQVYAASLGMHGAGGYRAQCGLVEGGLLFIGIHGSAKQLGRERIVQLCYDYAKAFEANYSSISCRDLRPEGFRENDPPHPCEQITVEAVWFTYQWLLNL